MLPKKTNLHELPHIEILKIIRLLDSPQVSMFYTSPPPPQKKSWSQEERK